MSRLQYQVVVGDTSSHLERQVNELLAEGWELLGGVSVAMDADFDLPCFFAQAMTKSVEPQDPPGG